MWSRITVVCTAWSTATWHVLQLLQLHEVHQAPIFIQECLKINLTRGKGRVLVTAIFYDFPPVTLFCTVKQHRRSHKVPKHCWPNVHSTLSGKSHRYYLYNGNFTADELTSSCSINWSNSWQKFCATQTNSSCKAKTWLLQGTVLLAKWIITQANPSL